MPSAAARQGPSCGEYAIFILKKIGKIETQSIRIFLGTALQTLEPGHSKGSDPVLSHTFGSLINYFTTLEMITFSTPQR